MVNKFVCVFVQCALELACGLQYSSILALQGYCKLLLLGASKRGSRDE